MTLREDISTYTSVSFLTKRQCSLRHSEQADGEDSGNLRITIETGCILCKARAEAKERTDIPK
jgi:hypothetical protein